MARAGSRVVIVMADEHPERDAWVDDRARDAQAVVQLIPIDSEHYRGVWTTPMGARVHVFADVADLICLEVSGGYLPPRCPVCDCRVYPQDGPGVHAVPCPYGWASYDRCETCETRAGARCVKPGTWPHPGRPLARFLPLWAWQKEGDRAQVR